ncbi:MAG TPA: alpha/beta hydrolase [Allosphingosinicella sp.]|uniref:alpha/beta fold hydrolase n=1 Tax=Allosphingosinicella sp. TaxID=2823234 RepID=UPI002EDA1776
MRFFTAPDGARITYYETGAGRPLLLLHGLMAHGGFFRFQDELADSFRLINVNLRGHGGSEARPEITVERLASDITALVDALNLEDAIAVGWSLGATILWHVLAGSASHRFAGSIIVDMTPKVLNEGDWHLGLSEDVCAARSAAIRDDYRSLALTAGQAIFSQPLNDTTRPLADWAGEEFARNDPKAIGRLWESLVAQDLRPLLPRVRQKSLVLRGAHSQLYGPGTAGYLAQTLPDASAIEFSRSAHAPHLEEPALFNSIIREFAAGLPHLPHIETAHS